MSSIIIDICILSVNIFTMYTLNLFYRNSQYDALDSLANFNEVPKTEDFITFLCLRGKLYSIMLI